MSDESQEFQKAAGLECYPVHLPVRTQSGAIVDIWGYSECYIAHSGEKGEQAAYYVHLKDNGIAVLRNDTHEYSSWDEFLANHFRNTIDQEKARSMIQQKYHYSIPDQIIKEINGVFLSENGTVYDCVGWVVYPPENYLNNRDIIAWRDYVFAISNDNRLRLVCKSGSDEFDERYQPVIQQFLDFEDVQKAAVVNSADLAVLRSDGNVFLLTGSYYFIENSDSTKKIEGWKNVEDITASSACLVGINSNNEILVYPENMRDKRWTDFQHIKLEHEFGGCFVPPADGLPDGSLYSHVYSEGEYIYGFNEDGEAFIFSLEGRNTPLSFPFRIKRFLLSRQRSKYGARIDRFYVVASDGTSFLLGSKNRPEELPGIRNLSQAFQEGCCTEQGEFFRAFGDYAITYDKEPFRTGIKTAFRCPLYYSFLYENGDLEVFTNKKSQFKERLVHGIKKACFTQTHIVFLYNDGRVGYTGNNIGKRCSGLEKLNDACDISATETETFVTRSNGEILRFPKKQ